LTKWIKMKYLVFGLILSFASPVSARITSLLTLPGGSNGEIQFNNDGLFGSNSDLTYSTTTNVLSVSTGTLTYLEVSTISNVSSIHFVDGTSLTGGVGTLVIQDTGVEIDADVSTISVNNVLTSSQNSSGNVNIYLNYDSTDFQESGGSLLLGDDPTSESLTVSTITATSSGTIDSLSVTNFSCSGCIDSTDLDTDYISETELDSESELETQLTDVTDILTDDEAILNQGTLQSGSTSYSDFLYVGSSGTIHGDFEVEGTLTGVDANFSGDVSANDYTGEGVDVSTITASSGTITNLSVTNLDADSLTFDAATVSTITVSSFTAISNAPTSQVDATLAYHLARYDQVKMIQVVSATLNGSTTTTNTSFTDTGLEASITPSSTTNSVLIIANGTLSHDASGFSGVATIARNGTNLGATHGLTEIFSAGATDVMPATLLYVDSPSTTSSTEYKVQFKTVSGSGTTGWANGNMQRSVLVLVEINGL